MRTVEVPREVFDWMAAAIGRACLPGGQFEFFGSSERFLISAERPAAPPDPEALFTPGQKLMAALARGRLAAAILDIKAVPKESQVEWLQMDQRIKAACARFRAEMEAVSSC